MLNSIVIYLPLFLLFCYFFFNSFLGIFLVYIYVGCGYLLTLICTLNLFLILQKKYVFYFNLTNIFVDTLDFHFSLNSCFEPLSVLMLTIVVFISTIVNTYSIWYMKNDPNYFRFFFFLNFFAFFMIVLVISNNIIQTFIGWEGIGIFSYLLINFWYKRLDANRSALKALVVNKVGDCFFYAFFCLYFHAFQNFNIYNTKLMYDKYINVRIDFLNYSFEAFTLIGFCLILAAVAKSAQIFLHVWLPDAMEGPTPVSALLHAATMVTAGIFVLIKFSWLFYKNFYLMIIIIIIGILTNLFASIVAIFQYDIKKIIAYSTASQLGLIFISFGIAKFNLAMFHIFTHAFFKALLFLIAGIIIHYAHNIQDLRLLKKVASDNLVFIYITFMYGTLTLAAIPFFSAYYSKDEIIQSSLINVNFFNYFGFFFLIISIITTSIYSFKVCNFLFWQLNSSFFKNLKQKSKYYFFNFALLFLVIFSIFLGFLFFNIFKFDYIFFENCFEYCLKLEKKSAVIYFEISALLIIFFTILGYLCGVRLFPFISFYFIFFSKYILSILTAFIKKFFFDTIYYFIFKLFYIFNWCVGFIIDRLLIEEFFVVKVYNFVKKEFFFWLKFLQAATWKFYLKMFIAILLFVVIYIIFKPIIWMIIFLAIIHEIKF